MKTRAFRTYAPELRRAIIAGMARICCELEEKMPLTANDVKGWLAYLSGSQQPADYYLRRPDLPMFLFPRFLEKAQVKPDNPFMYDRVYSTMNGFYYIRLLDDVTDHHDPDKVALLPALGFFHSQFQSPYQIYFAAEHPFWEQFRQIWFHSADVTLRDLRLRKLNRKQFVQIAAQKTCAVKIPIAAVACRYGREDIFPAWGRFMDAYGCWHQMSNDLFHWHEDLSLETATYFLSEAARRRRANETAAAWVIREGFEWGLAQLEEWMGQARELAGELESAELLRFLAYREDKVQKDAQETLGNLRAAAKLGSLLFS